MQQQLGNVLILGAGKTGISLARYVAGLLGTRASSVCVYSGNGTFSDAIKEELTSLGCTLVEKSEVVVGAYDLCIASPGISEFSDFVLSAKKAALEVISEPEFAYRESPDKWIAITGTNGKTTTTSLTSYMLQAGALSAKAVGNIGELCTDEVQHRTKNEWLVAECSSYQLALTQDFHPHIACLLNVTPDHLHWHKTFENYKQAKCRIFKNLQVNDVAVLTTHPEVQGLYGELIAKGVTCYMASTEGDPDVPYAAYMADGVLYLKTPEATFELAKENDLMLQGIHNVENALCSACMAFEAGVSVEVISCALRSFHALEHRQEPCGSKDGISFINDSKATNVDAVIKAVASYPQNKTFVLLGGHDKGVPFDSLAEACVAACFGCVCYGEAGHRIYEAIVAECKRQNKSNFKSLQAAHMEDALDVALQNVVAGDIILLSPACSSFDEFKDFEQRGEIFKMLVKKRMAK